MKKLLLVIVLGTSFIRAQVTQTLNAPDIVAPTIFSFGLGSPAGVHGTASIFGLLDTATSLCLSSNSTSCVPATTTLKVGTISSTTVTASNAVTGSNIKSGEVIVPFSATPLFTATSQFDTITLTGNITSFTISSGNPGQSLCLQFIQDGTGSRTVSGSPGNIAGFFTVGASASKSNVQCFVYSGQRSLWLAQSPGMTNM